MIAIHKIEEEIIISFDKEIKIWEIEKIDIKNNVLTIYFLNIVNISKVPVLKLSFELIDSEIIELLKKIKITKSSIVLISNEEIKKKKNSFSLNYYF